MKNNTLKKHILLYFLHILCMPLSFGIWIGIYFFITQYFKEVNISFVFLAVFIWAVVDAIIITCLKGDAFNKEYSNVGKGIYYVNKLWYYLDFIIGIPAILIAIIIIAKNGLGIPA